MVLIKLFQIKLVYQVAADKTQGFHSRVCLFLFKEPFVHNKKNTKFAHMSFKNVSVFGRLPDPYYHNDMLSGVMIYF